jgi:hypothetical protein
MKSIKKIALSAILAIFTALPALAEPGDNALLTIRFQAGNATVYQDKLFFVVREAVKAKPTVVFDVVSIAPNGQPNVYGAHVANDIKKIGVNPAQVTYRVENSAATKTEEVKIFVR